MFLIFNCYCCYSLPFLQQKPCQKLKLLIMRESTGNRGVRKRTLYSFSDTWGVQFRTILGFGGLAPMIKMQLKADKTNANIMNSISISVEEEPISITIPLTIGATCFPMYIPNYRPGYMNWVYWLFVGMFCRNLLLRMCSGGLQQNHRSFCRIPLRD